MKSILLAISLALAPSGCAHELTNRQLAKATVSVGLVAGAIFLMLASTKCDGDNCMH